MWVSHSLCRLNVKDLCRCVPDVGQHLGLVEVAIKGKLIPSLLDLPPEEVTDKLRALPSHYVKQGGLNFRKPGTGAARLNQASVEASMVLVESLLGNGELNFVGHKYTTREAFAAARKEKVGGKLEVMKVMLTVASKVVAKMLGSIGKAGA